MFEKILYATEKIFAFIFTLIYTWGKKKEGEIIKEIDAKTKLVLMRRLAEVAEMAGFAVLESKVAIEDISSEKQHEGSSIDIVARTAVIQGLEKKLPKLQGNLRFEMLPYGKKLAEITNDSITANLIIDEIDGSTNTKRAMASKLSGVPKAAVCIALCSGETLEGLQIGVIFTLDTKEVFAGERIEDGVFYTYKNKELIYPEDVCKMRGDSKYRVLVIKYSNSRRIEIAKVEEAFWQQGFRPYEGCRSSSMDILGIARNQFDAYVDIRALFPAECGAQLQAYDIAAVIPVALGLGLKISDVFGKSWEDYGENEAIPLVVSRPEIYDNIMKSLEPIVRELSEKYKYKRRDSNGS